MSQRTADQRTAGQGTAGQGTMDQRTGETHPSLPGHTNLVSLIHETQTSSMGDDTLGMMVNQDDDDTGWPYRSRWVASNRR